MYNQRWGSEPISFVVWRSLALACSLDEGIRRHVFCVEVGYARLRTKQWPTRKASVSTRGGTSFLSAQQSSNFRSKTPFLWLEAPNHKKSYNGICRWKYFHFCGSLPNPIQCYLKWIASKKWFSNWEPTTSSPTRHKMSLLRTNAFFTTHLRFLFSARWVDFRFGFSTSWGSETLHPFSTVGVFKAWLFVCKKKRHVCLFSSKIRTK